MENYRSVEQIAQNLGEYMCNVSKQIDNNGNLQYYLCGSLATILLSNATSIESCDIINNSVKTMREERYFTECKRRFKFIC